MANARNNRNAVVKNDPHRCMCTLLHAIKPNCRRSPRKSNVTVKHPLHRSQTMLLTKSHCHRNANSLKSTAVPRKKHNNTAIDLAKTTKTAESLMPTLKTSDAYPRTLPFLVHLKVRPSNNSNASVTPTCTTPRLPPTHSVQSQ